MKIIVTNIDVEAPLEVSYNCWTNFEQLPKFLDGVHEVIRAGINQLHWRAEILGAIKVGDIEIEELIPNKLISWRSRSGDHSSGALGFEMIDCNRTNIMLCLIYEETGAFGSNSSEWNLIKVLVDQWLNHFNVFIHQQKMREAALI